MGKSVTSHGVGRDNDIILITGTIRATFLIRPDQPIPLFYFIFCFIF